jgi:hypothetical protein
MDIEHLVQFLPTAQVVLELALPDVFMVGMPEME